MLAICVQDLLPPTPRQPLSHSPLLSSWIRLGVRDSKQFILLPPSTPLPAAKILPVPHAHLSQYLCPKVRKVGQLEPCRVVGRSECHGRRLAPAKQDVRRSGRRGGGSGCRRPAARIATPVGYLDAEHPSTVLHNCFAADPFFFFLTHPTPARRVIPDKVRTCLKCRVAPSQVIVRSGGTHGYCSACFLLMVTHKFRALIGKQRVIQRDERVSVHPHLCYNSMLFDIPHMLQSAVCPGKPVLIFALEVLAVCWTGTFGLLWRRCISGAAPSGPPCQFQLLVYLS